MVDVLDIAVVGKRVVWNPTLDLDDLGADGYGYGGIYSILYPISYILTFGGRRHRSHFLSR